MHIFINFFVFLVIMISIVGGGPIGCYFGYLISKEDDVCIFEEHSSIGKPVQCTGLVTKSLNNLVRLKSDFVVNKLSRVKIHSKNNSLELKLKRENIVLDREKSDKHLANLALDKGVKIYRNHKFLNYKRRELIFKGKKVKTDILIGADGPLSKVYSLINHRKREYYTGLQVRVKKKFEKDLFEVYFIKNGFIWVVPESNRIARIGVVGKGNIKVYLDNFLKKFKGRVIETQGGLIPRFDDNIISCDNNIYLVGDAAGMVKALSHGGIIQGLLASQELKRAILEKKNYEVLWRKRIGKDLKLSLFVREILDKFSEKDYDEFVALCKQKKVKTLLSSYDRDFLSNFFFKAIMKEPRFLRFGLKLI